MRIWFFFQAHSVPATFATFVPSLPCFSLLPSQLWALPRLPRQQPPPGSCMEALQKHPVTSQLGKDLVKPNRNKHSVHSPDLRQLHEPPLGNGREQLHPQLPMAMVYQNLPCAAAWGHLPMGNPCKVACSPGVSWVQSASSSSPPILTTGTHLAL